MTVPRLGQMCAVGVLLAALGFGVSSASGSSGATTRCAAASLAPGMFTNGAGGTIIVNVIVRNRSSLACIGRGRVTFALRDAKTRRLLRVAGNPYVKTFHRRLRAGRNSLGFLQWSNYCGPARPLVLETRLGARRVFERSPHPGARCEWAGAPSKLRLFRIRR